MKKILLVEDDDLLNKTLTYNLISEGYDTASALNAGTATELLTQTEYDLVLLDINLPDGSGYDLCRLIKPENPDTLVIFLTANDQESDQIRGYEVGAVDYITKPFSIGALLRKIRAMFAMLEHRGLAKDFYDDGRLFCKNPKQILTRQRLLERLWDADENYVDEHTLTTSISRIRGKIEADGDTYIKTIYGIGYQWMGGERK